jgi:hypothetical protein
VQNAKQVHVELPLQLRGSDLFDRAKQPVASVVDDYIEPTEARVRLLDGREARVPLGDVERDPSTTSPRQRA